MSKKKTEAKVEPKAKKGGWPKGKSRNKDTGEWGPIKLALISLLDHHHERGVISIRALARDLGVDAKTVHNWLHNVDRPPPEMQERIATWISSKK